MLFARIAAMPDASERDSPGVRSGSFITTSSAGDPPSHSPIFPGYKNSLHRSWRDA
jgi:hypothetical protein